MFSGTLEEKVKGGLSNPSLTKAGTILPKLFQADIYLTTAKVLQVLCLEYTSIPFNASGAVICFT